MCGRFVQSEGMAMFMEELGPQLPLFSGFVLTPGFAREWLKPDLEPVRAKEIAREHCHPVEDFEWFPVGKAVGNVRSQGVDLIRPIYPITLEW